VNDVLACVTASDRPSRGNGFRLSRDRHARCGFADVAQIGSKRSTTAAVPKCNGFLHLATCSAVPLRAPLLEVSENRGVNFRRRTTSLLTLEGCSAGVGNCVARTDCRIAPLWQRVLEQEQRRNLVNRPAAKPGESVAVRHRPRRCACWMFVPAPFLEPAGVTKRATSNILPGILGVVRRRTYWRPRRRVHNAEGDQTPDRTVVR
jgi:hypothetical protein